MTYSNSYIWKFCNQKLSFRYRNSEHLNTLRVSIKSFYIWCGNASCKSAWWQNYKSMVFDPLESSFSTIWCYHPKTSLQDVRGNSEFPTFPNSAFSIFRNSIIFTFLILIPIPEFQNLHYIHLLLILDRICLSKYTKWVLTYKWTIMHNLLFQDVTNNNLQTTPRIFPNDNNIFEKFGKKQW